MINQKILANTSNVLNRIMVFLPTLGRLFP